jgi:hypothetical protein
LKILFCPRKKLIWKSFFKKNKNSNFLFLFFWRTFPKTLFFNVPNKMDDSSTKKVGISVADFYVDPNTNRTQIKGKKKMFIKILFINVRLVVGSNIHMAYYLFDVVIVLFWMFIMIVFLCFCCKSMIIVQEKTILTILI